MQGKGELFANNDMQSVKPRTYYTIRVKFSERSISFAMMDSHLFCDSSGAMTWNNHKEAVIPTAGKLGLTSTAFKQKGIPKGAN